MSFWQRLWEHRAAILRIISALLATVGGYQVTQLASGDAPMSAENVAAPTGWFVSAVLPLIASFLTGPVGQGAFDKGMSRVFAFIRSKGPVDPTIRIVAAINLGNACIEVSHDNPQAKALAQQWKEMVVAALVKPVAPPVPVQKVEGT